MTKTNQAPMHNDKPTLLDMNATNKKEVTPIKQATIIITTDKYFIRKPFYDSDK